MKTVFLPSNEANTAKIPGQDVAMIIAEPDAMKDAPADKQWPVMFFLHGKDNLGGGTLSSLQTYWEGQFSGIPEDWKKAVDKYGIIGVALHYGGSLFSYNQWLWAYEFIRKRYKTYPRIFNAGFSWGAGSMQKCYTTRMGYCEQSAVLMQIAPTIENNTAWDLVGDVDVPVWVVVNKGDNVTGAAAAKKTVQNININAPILAATYTELNQNGHGGRNEALGLTPMPGFAENVYELFLDILKNGPRIPKLGTPTTPSEPVMPTTPTSTIKATVSYSITGNKAKLIGEKSTGWKIGYEGTWAFKSGPDGVTGKQVFPTGSSFINAEATLPKAGQYQFEFTLKIGTETKTESVTIVYGQITEPVKPKPVNFVWPDQLVFDDGSKLTVKPQFTANDGTVY